MKDFRYIPLILIATSLFAGCSSIPRPNANLDNARSNFQAAQGNPDVVKLAPLELKQASDALDSANAAQAHHESDKKIDELAYIAKQKIATAQEAAKQKSAEKEVANTAKERDQIRLEQRTTEADKANLNAADAQRQKEEAEAHSRQLQAQLDNLAAKKTERGIVITLGDVLFNTDKDQLKPDGMHNVQKLYEILNQNPQRVVLIEGYTDSTGSREHNQNLSERRALSVSAALIEMGISRDRISTRGYGEDYPAANNDSTSGRQINRRVEIVLSDNSGKVSPR